MKKKILTIEDNLVVAEDLMIKLESLGYEVIGNAVTLEETRELMEQETPDLMIVDILLGDGLSGIDIVKEVYKTHRLPIVYLTANSESAMVKMALETHPTAYMIKPFKLSEFVINIDLAIKNFEKVGVQNANPKEPFSVVEDAIFIPDQQMHVRIDSDDIYAVEADGSYIKILTVDKKHQISSNLKNFQRQFKAPGFIRVSRKHLVNAKYVQKINGNTIYVGPYEFQFARQNRNEILRHFPILKTK